MSQRRRNPLGELLVKVWAFSGNDAKCTRCGRPITWFINSNGKNMPFRRGSDIVHTEKDDRGCKWNYLQKSDCHLGVCRQAAESPRYEANA